MSTIDNLIRTAVSQAVTKLFDQTVPVEQIVVEIPKDSAMGDFATSVAMRLAKPLHTAPLQIANQLAEALPAYLPAVDHITVAKPGFINFWMKKAALADLINEVLKKDTAYGKSDSGHQEKILVEYVSANPTGDLHCGHARGAAWGDSVTRLLKAAGYDCLREYYINDGGHQIEMLGESLISRYFACFHQDYPLPEDGYHGPDVNAIAKQIASQDGDKWLTADPDQRKKYFMETGSAIELEKIKKDLELFRVSFDSWIHEKFFYENNQAKINEVLDKMGELNLTYEQDQALWFRSTTYGDDKDRVLRKSDGSLTYLTPDIANHVYKLQRGYTKLVDLWGADHHGYVKRMTYALQALGYPQGCLQVDLIQMVRMMENGEEVKMSKRTGNAISLRELCEDVGVDATRWFFVSKDVGTHMDFDMDLARKKTTDNPVYYVQYAHARMCSIIKNAPAFTPVDHFDRLTDPKETELLKHLSNFTEVVADAAATRMPNKICNYATNLAKHFHSFYVSCKCNVTDDPELTNQRLGLVHAVRITMRNALDLIGVQAVEHM